MNENERDTQFKDFAALLWQELDNIEDTGYIQIDNAMYAAKDVKCCRIIAQRAYDLVYHALETSGLYLHPDPLGPDYIPDTAEIIPYVTDLTEWPKTN